MLHLDDLTRFYRFYFAQYRIDHELTLVEDKSMWSSQLTVQPALLSQSPLVRKVFKNQTTQVDDNTGNVLMQTPIKPVSDFLVLNKLFAGFDTFLSGLTGSTFQLQVLIAPMDPEYNKEFTMTDQWQWLISSQELTELFLSGKVTENGIEFDTMFHSCHQADLNRDFTEDSTTLVTQWDNCYGEVLACAGVKQDSLKLNAVADPLSNVAANISYRMVCEDSVEAEKLVNLASLLGIAKASDMKIEGNLLESKVSYINMADMIFSTRFSETFNVFGADPQ